MYTKRHFNHIAELIHEQVLQIPAYADSEARAALYKFASNFAIDARRHNPRFDRVKFLEACGFIPFRTLNKDQTS